MSGTSLVVDIVDGAMRKTADFRWTFTTIAALTVRHRERADPSFRSRRRSAALRSGELRNL